MIANPYVRRWYEKHKDDPEVRERLRNHVRNWRAKNKHTPQFKEAKAKHDLLYKLKVRDTPEYREKRNRFNLKYRSNAESSASSLQSVHEWKSKNAEKVRAHYAVRYAIRVGKLIRPETCEKCGIKPAPQRDGKSGIHAHHQDYSKRLEVQWLCAFCHGNERRTV